MNRKAVEWLRETYPFAMSDAERLRQALNDAKQWHDKLEELELPNE